MTGVSALKEVREIIETIRSKEGVNVSEVKGGSRRRQISQVRKRIAKELIERYGIPMAIIARETGVTTTAVSKIMASPIFSIHASR